MKKAAMVLALLMIGGCAASHQDSAEYEKRALCQSTSIGSEPKTICY